MNENKYIVAMSGGVDSSVAAAMLIEQGLSVQGVIMRIWGDEIDDDSVPSVDSLEQARRNSQRLGIDLEILDVREAFNHFIIDQFLKSYLDGLTPNPCVLCNKFIKFGVFLEETDLNKGGQLVTGHYARIVETSEGAYQLQRAIDKSKDQSYFLCRLNQNQLQRSIFPLGELYKADVWEKAKYFGIEIKGGRESQDLCFLRNQDYRRFLDKKIKGLICPGDISDRNGKVLGSHKGLAYYTIGQRKGLGVHASRPMFVLDKDAYNNRLIIGFEEELGKDQMIVKDVNWISGALPEENFRAQVKIRSTAKNEWACILKERARDLRVKFERPLRDITPGQFAVFYERDIVLGGGEIRT